MTNDSNREREFVQLIKQYERVIYKVCASYVSEAFPMADRYQEVVCNLWTGYPKFRGECAVSTWIYRVALNTCITNLRRDRHRPKGSITAASLAETLVAPESMDENIREMYRLINRLQPMEKAIILLWLEERSYQEIADITGLSVSNVAVKLKRAKEKLVKMSNL